MSACDCPTRAPTPCVAPENKRLRTRREATGGSANAQARGDQPKLAVRRSIGIDRNAFVKNAPALRNNGHPRHELEHVHRFFRPFRPKLPPPRTSHATNGAKLMIVSVPSYQEWVPHHHIRAFPPGLQLGGAGGCRRHLLRRSSAARRLRGHCLGGITTDRGRTRYRPGTHRPACRQLVRRRAFCHRRRPGLPAGGVIGNP